MLKIGGENVAAVELESFLATHPAIRMAQVVGVPDERLMEVAAAFIELNPGEALSEEDVARHCAGRIASYKIPRYVRFVESWPMSATKVQKFELLRGFTPERKIDPAASRSDGRDAHPRSRRRLPGGRPRTAGGSRAGWYLIFVLTLAYTASFIDRQVLNLLVGPIKAEFGLDDTRLSLLQGLAFTLAYVVMSPVFGRIADVGSRKGVLMFGIALWSIGTSACGLARSYWQLFLARFGVGGAEACLTPAAWSIIADAFPPRLIPRAFSVYMMGPYLGGDSR
ncbi:MFS transporter [Novosphingobium resinovorum]